MKTTITFRFLILILITFSLNRFSSAEMIPVSSDYTAKYLFASAESKSNSVSDGTIVCWLDESYRGSLYIQRLGSNGEKLWSQNGLIVDKDLGRYFDPDSDYPVLFSDNEGGAVVIYRKLFYSEEEIYCAKISSEGELLRRVCLSSGIGGYNFSPSAVLTKDNCIAVVWENFSSGDFNIQGQKIDLSCNKLWNSGNEINVCNVSDDQRKPSVLCDQKNQLLVTWLDTRSVANSSEFAYDLYVNKLDESGNFAGFGQAGRLILSFPIHRYSGQNANTKPDENYDHGNGLVSVKKAELYNHNMISSGNNSAIVAVDIRESETDSYIRVFKINEELNIEWDRDIEAESYQQNPLIISDDCEGAVIVWNDSRNNENSIFGMRVNGSGSVITERDNGFKISFDKGKKNSLRSLPDKRNMSGLVISSNKLLIPWTVSDSHDLYLASVDLNYSSQYKNTSELIYKNISEGKCTSVLQSNETKSVIFLKDNTIFASKENKSDKISKNQLKNNFKLLNYPNPFNPVTKISYQLIAPGNAIVKIYDMTGRIVKELVNEFQNAGRHELTFDGSSLSSGLYFCRIDAGNYSETMRMTLLK